MLLTLPEIDLLDSRVFAARREHGLFRRLRNDAPLFWNPEPDGRGFWSLTRHADVVAAARDHRRFLSGKGTQIRDKRAEGHGHPSVHNADPPLHGRLRAPGLAALSRARVEAHRCSIAAIVEALLDAAPTGEPFDFVADVARLLPMLVIADMLGVPRAEAPILTEWANTMSDIGASDAQQAASRGELFAYFRRLAADKRRHPQDDVASVLVQHFPGAGGEEILDAYFMLLTVAGNETTRFLLAEGLEALVSTDGALEELRCNPGLIPLAVDEMCRFVSPVIQMRRTAAENLDLHGRTIRAGDKVVLWFSSANRDDRVFEDPDRLMVARHPNPHLGFGVGAHFCLGAHLARLETSLFLEALLRRVGTIEIVAPAERTPSNWFAATERLVLRWS